jgi:cytidine deaminase
MSHKALIDKALSVVNAYANGPHIVGDVGCALVTEAGHVFTGVCIDAPSGMGFCAEHNAIGAMVTAGETRIRTIVAVWREGADRYVLSPCGRCRQFIYQTDKANIDTEVVLSAEEAVPLRELLPLPDWFKKLD